MAEPAFEHLKCRSERGVLVVTLGEQRLQGDDLADAIRQELFHALDHFQLNRVVLDFQEVKYLGSAGFRPLLSLFRRLRDAGGYMILCNLSHEVLDVLHVTRLITTTRSMAAPFEVAPTLAEAIARLQEGTEK